MAHRARQNIEVLLERLTADGYAFHANDDEQAVVPAHVPPTATAAEHADWLANQYTEIPMTVLSWVRLVGDVWLVGTHPQWPASVSADPLVIELEGSRDPDELSIRDYFQDEWTELNDYNEEHGEADVFVLPLAPDRLHKENTSGGPPYGIALPDGCVDGLFVGETITPFVAYLNRVFETGGFPYSTGSPDEWRIKRDLARDLLPL
ncbi:hypothetical protein Val02_78430 [Virgisporangium aliadipatigenens]|uniref:Uncharacterized protein n=2 Tax=Virgisporangium aliadipatigenens TaxID=741659 RepID=A0A8J3YUK6_9ACTN|nr:hypothetical protein Val02_78430 [Virgisporangium aliadipatigenens]